MTLPNSTASDLVQIGSTKKHCPASWKGRATSGPVVDKFFALGALFGFVGTVGYGLYLWLALNNLLPVTANYLELRQAHAVVQVYLFFGLFVLGFISQAGGKMLGADLRFGKRPLLLLPLYIAGAIGLLLGQAWGAVVVSACFALYAIFIPVTCVKGCARPLQAVLAVSGLAVLALSPFFPPQSPNAALLIVWGGFGTMIFAASGQFIGTFLGGSNLSGRSGIAFVALHLLSVALMLLDLFYRPLNEPNLSAALAVAAIVIYGVSTNAGTWLRSLYPNPLGLAFVCGYSWALASWVLQLTDSNAAADLTVHILATGWAAPIIFAVSSQVVGFLTGKDSLLPPRLWWGLLLAWQLVPVGRGAFHLLGLPSWFSIVVALASVAVITTWATSLCWAEWKMLRLQSVLTKGEVLKTCG